jgi:asparagine synthase (glutamine-hydrolysing)
MLGGHGHRQTVGEIVGPRDSEPPGMCGIAGALSPREDAPARVGTMLDALAHRGPDGRGLESFAGGAIGMVRLALVDPTERGQQPMWSADRQVGLVFNGEIYNFRAERARLEKLGRRFRSGSDTEVVLELYLERGLGCVELLRGMFAFAVVDWRAGGDRPRLVLARDQFGIKPLYLTEGPTSDELAFASELRALVAGGYAGTDLDPIAVADFLATGFVVGPRTILRDVRLMAPGTIECIEPDGARRTHRYAVEPLSDAAVEPLSDAAVEPLSDAAVEPLSGAAVEPYWEAVDRLRGVMEDSIAVHSFADVPVGAFLSGGIDSTAVVALMRSHIDELHTFSLEVAGDPTSEAGVGAQTARVLGTHHHEVHVGRSEAAACYPQFVAELDQPSTDGFNTWLVSRAAATQVKGVLSGLGGDEFFAGYPLARRLQTWSRSRGRPLLASVGALAHRGERLVPPGPRHRRLGDLAARRSVTALWLQGHRVFSETLARRAVGGVGGEPVEVRIARILDDVAPSWRDETPLGMCRLLDTYVYMGQQLLRDSDVTSMAHSLELRVPFVDREVAAFSRSCLDEYKLEGGPGSVPAGDGTGKRILVDSLADLLPDHVRSRAKQGFALPLGELAAVELRPVMEDALRVPSLAAAGAVDPATVAQLVAAFPTGDPFHWYPQNWALATLELWHRALVG